MTDEQNEADLMRRTDRFVAILCAPGTFIDAWHATIEEEHAAVERLLAIVSDNAPLKQRWEDYHRTLRENRDRKEQVFVAAAPVSQHVKKPSSGAIDRGVLLLEIAYELFPLSKQVVDDADEVVGELLPHLLGVRSQPDANAAELSLADAAMTIRDLRSRHSALRDMAEVIMRRLTHDFPG